MEKLTLPSACFFSGRRRNPAQVRPRLDQILSSNKKEGEFELTLNSFPFFAVLQRFRLLLLVRLVLLLFPCQPVSLDARPQMGRRLDHHWVLRLGQGESSFHPPLAFGVGPRPRLAFSF